MTALDCSLNDLKASLEPAILWTVNGFNIHFGGKVIGQIKLKKHFTSLPASGRVMRFFYSLPSYMIS